MPVVAKYNYQNSKGETLYTINRTDSKIFFPTTPSPDIAYDECERVPYGLPRLLSEADHAGTAWVVESEKTSDLMNSLGFVTTCSAGGASWQWPTKWSEYFKGLSQVFVCADNDKAGREAAVKRAKIISLVVDDVRIIYFPELPEKHDPWDYLQTNSADDLWKRAEYADQYKLISTPINLNTEQALCAYLIRPTHDKSFVYNNVNSEDFVDPFWRQCFISLSLTYRLGLTPDPESLAARMIESGFVGKQSDLTKKLWDTLDDTNFVNDYYKAWVDDIVNSATKRSVERATKSVIASISSGKSSEDLVAAWENASKSIRTVVTAADPSPDLDEFMSTETSYNWMINDILEYRDRLIVVGVEGHGKSSLMRQWACMTAAGIQWFNHSIIDPKRVLIIDRENSPGQVQRGLQAPVGAADARCGKAWHKNLAIDAVPSAINILETADRRWLESKIVANRPDLIVLAPLYKLFNDNSSIHQELNAQTVAKIIDDWRENYNVAVLIEAHAPHGDGMQRDFRVQGSSVWRRWSEIGFGLAPTDIRHTYEVKDFRGRRNDVYFPKYMFWNPEKTGWQWLHTDNLDEEDENSFY